MTLLTELPAGANVVDLGAARTARAEARAASGIASPYVKLSAGYVELKPEIAVESAILLEDGDYKGGLGSLLADPTDVDALIADGLSKDDLQVLMTFITGLDAGESSGSSAS